MEVTITMKGLEKLPEVAEENIKSKIGRLEKYFDNIQRCNVVINKVRGVLKWKLLFCLTEDNKRGW